MRLAPITAVLLGAWLASVPEALAQSNSQPPPASFAGAVRLLTATRAEIEGPATHGTHSVLVLVIDASTRCQGIHQGDTVFVVYRPGKPANLALVITKESSQNGVQSGPVGGTAMMRGGHGSNSIELASVAPNPTGFGMASIVVTLSRTLPAITPIPGSSFGVEIYAVPGQANTAQNLRTLVETEFLKSDSTLHLSEDHPEVTIVGHVVEPPSSAGAGSPVSTAAVSHQEAPATLILSYTAKSRDGTLLAADDVSVTYNQIVGAAGTGQSQAIMGRTLSWHPVNGLSKANNSPRTQAEIRETLLETTAHRVAEQFVTTREPLTVRLAKVAGPLSDGDKEAEAGLWERSRETFEAAPPLPTPQEDAYRFYNVGVACEALAYQAEDEGQAVKLLRDADVNYGKAIDANPNPKDFVEAQKRVESALLHYSKAVESRMLIAQQHDRRTAEQSAMASAAAPGSVAVASAPPAAPANASSTPAATPGLPANENHRALTNSQIIAMVRAGVSDNDIETAIRKAKTVAFDLSSAGQHQLIANGVRRPVLDTMKLRFAEELAN